jgi:hypothetical protein
MTGQTRRNRRDHDRHGLIIDEPRREAGFQNKLLSAMRFEFGAQREKAAE